MTAVIFKFVHPDGTPVADAPFTVSLRKASFDEKLDDGLIMPGDVAGLTDALGLCTLELVPGFGMYYLTMSVVGTTADENGCVGGLRYRFQVPDSAVPVHAEDIIVTTPTWSRPWDEVAIQIIIDAKLATVASAAAAKESEIQAGLSEVASEASAVRSEEAAVTSTEQAEASRVSAEQAALSQVASKASEDATKLSEIASGESAVAAQASAEFAANVITDAQAQVDEATRQAGLSAASAVASGDFATTAQLQADAAAQHADQTAADAIATGNDVITTNADKLATAADVVTITGLKSDVIGLKDQTQVFRDEAMAAAGSLTGSIVDGGPIDLSGNVYPSKPAYSTLWKVQVGGTVPGADGDTYGAGDTLMYTKDQGIFYKIDNTENVSSVNGQTGVVVLTKASINLSLVDNTSDLDKPISLAQAAENAARTKTVGSIDTTAGRLVKVGDYGMNGGPSLAQTGSVDADTLIVPGRYNFTAGGLNLPATVTACYIDVIGYGTAGYCKQVLYGFSSNIGCYERYQASGTWSAWVPAIALVDDLLSTDVSKALTAKQGKVLKDTIDALPVASKLNRSGDTLTGALNGAPLVTIASSATPAIGAAAANTLTVTGTTGITGFDNVASGAERTLIFSGILTLTHNPASLILPGGVNTVTAVGDVMKFTSLGGGVWKCVSKTTASSGGATPAVGKGYIDGLILQWDGAKAVSVSEGSAYIESSGTVLDVAARLSLTGLTISASTWYHAYLYSNAGAPALELVTTAPAAPYSGKARSQTGANTRRYLGSFKSDASGNLYKQQFTQNGKVQYFTAIGTAPFQLTTGGFTTTPTTFSAAAVVPVTSTIAEGTVHNPNAGQGLYFANSHLSTPNTTNYLQVYIAGLIYACISLDASQTFILYFDGAATNVPVIRICAYHYER